MLSWSPGSSPANSDATAAHRVWWPRAQATVAWSTFAGHWLTPYTLEPVQWLLVIWLLVRWVRLRDDHLLVALGVVVGLAAMTKFQVLLLCGAAPAGRRDGRAT